MRQLVYDFLNLSYVKQTKILADLELLDKCDENKRYATIIKKIIDKATEKNVLGQFFEKINSNKG